MVATGTATRVPDLAGFAAWRSRQRTSLCVHARTALNPLGGYEQQAHQRCKLLHVSVKA
ncbi:MAG: hypothetical protein MUE46_14715 [Xanthomonadales bacterium]|jgi:hypothetical protein|nr:hypothetical protein [Xanthomonadales bacterium]